MTVVMGCKVLLENMTGNRSGSDWNEMECDGFDIWKEEIEGKKRSIMTPYLRERGDEIKGI